MGNGEAIEYNHAFGYRKHRKPVNASKLKKTSRKWSRELTDFFCLTKRRTGNGAQLDAAYNAD